MAHLSKASNVVQEKYNLYDVTGFTQMFHSIPVATNSAVIPPRHRPDADERSHLQHAL